jgi:hypothetical protein
MLSSSSSSAGGRQQLLALVRRLLLSWLGLDRLGWQLACCLMLQLLQRAVTEITWLLLLLRLLVRLHL